MSVSTTAGGVPRRWTVPGRTCTAPAGGTRTSTERPGWRAPSSSREKRTAVRIRARGVPSGSLRHSRRAARPSAGSIRRLGTPPMLAVQTLVVGPGCSRTHLGPPRGRASPKKEGVPHARRRACLTEEGGRASRKKGGVPHAPAAPRRSRRRHPRRPGAQRAKDARCASKAPMARSRSSWVPGVVARPDSSNCSLRMRM